MELACHGGSLNCQSVQYVVALVVVSYAHNIGIAPILPIYMTYKCSVWAFLIVLVNDNFFYLSVWFLLVLR